MSFNNKNAELISPVQTIVGSSHGWLALFDFSTGDLFLTNPITGRLVNLPSIILERYKVIISCEDPESEECRVIMISSDSLAFCCPSLSTEWTVVGKCIFLKRDYKDVVFSNKSLFCLCTEYLECWDVGNLHSPNLHWSNQNDLLGEQNYLSWCYQEDESLSSSGFDSWQVNYLVAAPDHRFFLVTRFLETSYGTTIAFGVHKIELDEDGGGKLSYVEGTSLDGLSIFVGRNHSLAVTASDHQLNPNSIYFTDYMPNVLSFRCGGLDIGIFDYQSKTIYPCYFPCNLQSIKKIVPAPIWFTPSFE